MRSRHPLVLEVSQRDVSAGSSIAVRVFVRNARERPVENAVVRVGSQIHRTDEEGRCRLTIRSPGLWRVTTYKAPTEQTGYVPASTLLRVHSGTTTTGQLRRLGVTPA